MSEDFSVGQPVRKLRAVMTVRGVAWLDPEDVKTIRRVADDERAALKVPAAWRVALRVRIKGDEAWIVRGDPWPEVLAEVVEDGSDGG